jgi:hypothetical protein
MAEHAERHQGRIASIRLQHPTEDRYLEVRFESGKYDQVDVVFTSVNAVQRILVPFYEAIKPGEGEQLLRETEGQQLDGTCMVLHQYRCRSAVPEIDWDTRSPIIL